MKKLHHANLVRVYAVCSQEQPFYIIRELMNNGNLKNYVMDEGQNLKLLTIIDIAVQVSDIHYYICVHIMNIIMDLLKRGKVEENILKLKYTHFK